MKLLIINKKYNDIELYANFKFQNSFTLGNLYSQNNFNLEELERFTNEKDLKIIGNHISIKQEVLGFFSNQEYFDVKEYFLCSIEDLLLLCDTENGLNEIENRLNITISKNINLVSEFINNVKNVYGGNKQGPYVKPKLEKVEWLKYFSIFTYPDVLHLKKVEYTETSYNKPSIDLLEKIKNGYILDKNELKLYKIEKKISELNIRNIKQRLYIDFLLQTYEGFAFVKKIVLKDLNIENLKIFGNEFNIMIPFSFLKYLLINDKVKELVLENNFLISNKLTINFKNKYNIIDLKNFHPFLELTIGFNMFIYFLETQKNYLKTIDFNTFEIFLLDSVNDNLLQSGRFN